MLNFSGLGKRLSKSILAVLITVATIVSSVILPYQAIASEPTDNPASTNCGTINHGGNSADSSPANTLPDLPSHLDLSSTEASLAAPVSSPVELIIGGTANTAGAASGGTVQIINPGEMLTPAQYTALHQVMTTGVQTLLLADNGSAVGGYASITPGIVNSLSSLLIPQNVSINSIGFDHTNPLAVSGSANILGSLYMLQPEAGITSVFNAGNLYIGPGGLLSGYLPGSAGLPSDIFASAGLSVNVVNDLVNQGTITSPGTLSILAGGDIINQSINNIQATISAQTLNLISGTGTFINSGMLSALEMLNIQTRDTLQNILFDNQNGILQSLEGVINFRDVLYAGKTDILVNGGDVLSTVLNINGGEGKTTFAVNRLTALTNISAGEAYLTASDDNVNLGNIALLGDPVFFNSTGAFTINGSITTNGGDLLIMAATDILLGAGTGDSIINTTRTSGGAATSGNVWLIAGGVLGGAASGDTGMTPNLSAGPFTVTSVGSLGGNIILSNGNNPATPAWSIDTRAEAGSGQGGGSLTMIAFNGSGGGGRIEMGANRNIATGGDGTGVNGSVFIIGGGADVVGPPAEAIFMQDINTTGGTGTGGAITIYTATPITTTNQATGATIAAVSFSQAAASGILRITPTNSFAPTGGTNLPVLTANASIRTGSLTSNGQLIRLFAGNNIVADTINSSQTSGSAAAGNILAYAQNGSFTGNQILAQGAAVGTGSNGGIIRVIAGQNIALNTVQSNGGGTGPSAGGQIDLIAGALSGTTAANTTIRIDSGSVGSINGGSIDISNGGTINSAGSGSGTGADITIVAFKGSVGTATSGRINIDPTAIISLGGASTGNNGNLLMVAAEDTAGVNGITAGTISSSSGQGTAGNIRIGTTAVGFTGNVSYTTTTTARTNTFALSLTDNTSLRNSNIALGDITTNGGLITLTGGQNITTGALSTSRSTGFGAGGAIALSSTAGNINVSNINTDGNNGNGGNVYIWSGGNIEFGNVSARGIDSDLANRNGGAIEIIAGLNMVLTNSVFSSGTPTNTTNGGSLSINGTSVASTGANLGSGGIITLAAHGGASSGGNVNGSSSLVIDASGGIGGSGNLIKILAGSTNSGTTSISLGNVTNGSSSFVSSAITITTTNTLATSPYTLNVLTMARTGTVNADLSNLSALQDTDVSVGALTTQGGIISVVAGGNINSLDISTSRLNSSGNSAGIALVSKIGNITVNGDINSYGNDGNGGSALLWSGGNIEFGNISTSGTDSGTTLRTGGAIEIIAGLNMVLTNGVFSSGTPTNTANGGSITTAGTLITSKGVNNGSGGTITLAAHGGASSGGKINGTSSLIIDSSTDTGTSGQIKLFAGSTDTGTTAITVGNVTSGLGTGTNNSIFIATANTLATSVYTLNALTAVRGGTISADLSSSATLQNTHVSAGTLTTQGGLISVTTGGNFNSLDISTARINGSGSGASIAIVSRLGNILVDGDIRSDGNDGNGGAIYMWSGGNIEFGNIAARGIDSGATARSGGAIGIIAGLNMDLTNNVFSSGVPTNSTGGGSITSSGTLITNTGTNAGAGNSITMAAHGGSAGGLINGTGNLIIDASGGAAGAGGQIKLFAGSTNTGATSITTGNITNGSGTGTSPGIIIATTNTIATSPYTLNVVTAATTGAINADLTDLSALQNTHVSTGTLTTHGGLISVTAGGSINSLDITTARLNGTGAGNFVALISHTGNIAVNGDIYTYGNNGNGGAVTLWSGGNIEFGNISTRGIDSGATARNGGNIEIIAGLNMGLATNIFSSGTPTNSASGGSITSSGTLITSSGANAGTVGAITLAAHGGAAGGTINGSNNLVIDASGATGAGGQIKLFAGSTDAGTTAITMGNVTNGSGTGTSSSILIATANTLATSPYTFNPTNGARTGTINADLSSSSTLQNTHVSVGTLTTHGGLISAAVGGDFNSLAISTARLNGTGGGANIALVSRTGNIVINGDINSNGNDGGGGNIYLWSGGNIEFANISARGIDSGATTRAGGVIEIIAGLNMNLAGNIFGSGTPTNSTGGGSITSTGTSVTSSGANAGVGGAITMAAHGGSTGGLIDIGNLAIDASGGVTGAGGQIKLFAGSTAGGATSIALDTVTNGSGAGTSGSILIATANTLATSPYTLNFISAARTGTVNADLTDLSTLQNTNVSINTLTTHGGAILASAGGNFSSPNITTSRLSGTGNGGNIAIFTSAGSANLASLSADGNAIVATGTVGNGGAISIWSGRDITFDNISSQGAGLGNRNGGAIELLAGLNMSLAANVFSTDGDPPASASGGNIIAAGNSTLTSTGINAGTGGAITLAASAGSGGGIINGTGLSIDSSGGPAGTGGEIKLFAGSTATGTTSIAIDSVTNGSGTGTSGAIRIATANFRTLNTAGTIVTPIAINAVSGSRTGGSVTANLVDLAAIQNTNVEINTLNSNGGLITAVAGGNITTGAISSARDNGTGAGGSVALVSKLGDIVINGNISSDGNNGNGGAVYMWSGGNIEFGNISARGIDSGATTRAGGAIEIVAGLNMDLNANVFSSGNPTSSVSGGNITTTGTLITSVGANAGSGGAITLAAHGGSSGGTINGSSNLVIDASGGATGAGGAIKLFAGSTNAGTTSITVGDVTNGSGTGASGTILIATADTLASSAYSLTFTSTGITRAGVINPDLTSSTTLQDTNVSTGTLTTHGAAISVSAGGNFSSLDIITSRLSGTGNGGNIAIFTKTGSATLANLTADGNALTATGTIGNGGAISIWSGQNTTAGNISSRGFGLGNRTGGTIDIYAGVATDLVAGVLSTSGASPASASGGKIVFVSGTSQLQSQGINGGSGNRITLAAFGGTNPDSGTILGADSTTLPDLITSGGATGSGGAISIFAGHADTANQAVVLGNLTTSGGTGVGAGAAGIITLITSNALTSGTDNAVNLSTGARSGGTLIGNLADLSVLNNTGVSVGAVSTNGNLIQLVAGGELSTGAITSKVSGTGVAGSIALISTTGNINITGDIVADGLNGNGGRIFAWAGQDINLANVSARGTDTGATSRTGGIIELIAGLNMTLNANTFSSAGDPPNSTSGGNINVSTGTLITSIGANGGAGGTITMAALAGSSGGNINGTNNLVIDASGGATGAGAAIKLFAGSTSSGTTAITVGDITNGAGTGTSSFIQVVTANARALDAAGTVPTPATLNLPPTAINRADGVISANLVDTAALQDTHVSTGNITTHGGAAMIAAGGNITAGDITTSRLAGTASGGNISLYSETGNIAVGTLAANGNAVATTGTANGGTIAIWSAGNINVGDISSRGLGSGNRSGSTVDLYAGIATILDNNVVTTAGTMPGSIGGGSIIFQSGTSQITTTGVGTGAGGRVTLAAFGGTDTSSGIVSGIDSLTLPDINSGGSSSGANGDIRIFAGHTTAGNQAVSLGNLNTTGGSGIAGSIIIASSNANTSGSDNALTLTSGARNTSTLVANLQNLAAMQDTDITVGNLSTNGQNAGLPAVQITTSGNILTGDIATTRINGSGAGGAITLTSFNNNITTGIIEANGNVSGAGGNVAFLAGANIEAVSITTNAGGTGNLTGGFVTLIAGANLDIPAAGVVTIPATGSASATGGLINLTGSGTTIASNGANPTQAINVVLVAYDGTGMNSGRVSVAGDIASQTLVGGQNGNVLIIGGESQNGATAVSTGAINTSGASTNNGGSGTIYIAGGTPELSSPFTLTISSAGAPIAPFAASLPSIQQTGISTGALTTNGAAITVLAGNDFTTNNNDINASRLSGNGVGGNISISSQYGSINIGSGNDILAAGNNAASGIIFLEAENAVVARDIVSSTTGSGNAGTITIAGASINLRDVYANGGTTGGAGAAVSLSSGTTIIASTISSSGSLAGGNAGSISLTAGGDITVDSVLAEANVNGSGGDIDISTTGSLNAYSVAAAGAGSGNGGNILVYVQGVLELDSAASDAGLTGNGNAGNIILASESLLNINSGISANGGDTGNGGNISLLSAGDINLTGFVIGSLGGASGGNAGAILVVAGTNLTNGTTEISLGGASATGGSITADLLLGFDAEAQGGNGQGGNITLIAYDEASGSGNGGRINLGTMTTAISSGNNLGTSGNVLMIAGDKDAAGADTLVASSILTSCCGGVGGSVTLATTAIQSSGAMNIDKSSGQLDGSFAANQTAVQNGSINMQMVLTDAGNITVLAGANINTNGQDLITDAFITGNTAGNINLSAGGSISSGNISAQGLGTGNGGTISIDAGGTLSTENITADAIDTGNGGTIIINQTAAGSVQIMGDISANSLSSGAGGNIAIQYNDPSNPFNIGGVTSDSFVSGLVQANSVSGAGGSITIINNATGGTANLVISGNTGILDTGGSTNGNVILNSPSGGSVDVSLGQIIGTVTGSASTGFTLTTAVANLFVQDITSQTGNILLTSNGGNLNAAGSIAANDGFVTLSSTAALLSSASITSANGPLAMNAADALIISAGTLSSSLGSVNLTAGMALTVQDGSSITAYTDVNLNAITGIAIGQSGGSGVTINAGVHQAGADIPYEIIARNTAISNGSILISSTGAGDVYLGDGVNLASHGGAGNPVALPGSIGIFSGRSINADAATLTAWGGDVWLNATVDMTLNGTGLFSVAKLNDNGATATSGSGATFPAYTGGGIALLAGVPAADAPAILQAQVSQRPYMEQNIIDIDPSIAFNQASPNFSIENGSILRIIMSSLLPQAKNVDPDLGNIYNISGGVIFMDPPGNPTITLTNVTLTAIGPASTPTPQTPTTNPVAIINPVPVQLNTVAGTATPSFNLSFSAVNLGVPTDRIFYQISLGQQSTHKNVLAYKTRGSWITLEGPHDPISIDEQSGAFIIGEPGTMVSLVEKDALAMKPGRLVLIAGAAPITMHTSLGIVQVPANGIILIDNSQNSNVTVTNLSTADAHMYAVFGTTVKEVKIAPRQELSVQESDAGSKQAQADNLLFNSRYINSQAIFNNDQLLTSKAQPGSSQRINLLKTALETNVLPESRLQDTNNLPPAAGPDKKDSTTGFDSTSGPNQPGSSNLQPIAYASPAVNATSRHIQNFENNFLTVKYNARSQFSSSGKIPVLSTGEALIICHRPASLQLGAHILELRPGTVALVSASNTATKVRNLWEERHGSLKEIVGQNFIVIGPGQELVVANSEHELDRALSADQLGRRHVLRSATLSNHAVAYSEYSILSLLMQSDLLQDLTARRNSNDANLADKIMKMAACLQIVTAKHGNYSNTNGR